MFYKPMLLPLLALVFLTFIVWFYMYVTRLAEIRRKRIDPQDLDTRIHSQSLLIDSPRQADNLKNLFEVPVLYYGLCLYLFVSGNVDSGYVVAAWLFFLFRAFHSVVHCTRNIVMLRFYLYSGAALSLWFMLGKALIGELAVYF